MNPLENTYFLVIHYIGVMRNQMTYYLINGEYRSHKVVKKDYNINNPGGDFSWLRATPVSL